MALTSSARLVLSRARRWPRTMHLFSTLKSANSPYYGNVSVTDVVEKCSWLSPPVLGLF